MKHIIIILAVIGAYRTIVWFLKRVETAFHRNFHNQCITMWSAVTDCATYRLVTSRNHGYIVLYRVSFKWGKEERIMKSYFVNLSKQMISEKANPLTFTQDIVADVEQHIQEYYGENITISRTN